MSDTKWPAWRWMWWWCSNVWNVVRHGATRWERTLAELCTAHRLRANEAERAAAVYKQAHDNVHREACRLTARVAELEERLHAYEEPDPS